MASLLGIEVRVHFLFVVWIALTLAHAADVLAVLELHLLLFGSILLHELGHCLGCRAMGGEAPGIVLYPFGGASLLRTPRTPKAELISVAAGPAVNLLLALLGLGGAVALGALGPALEHPLGALGLSDEAAGRIGWLERVALGLCAINALLFAFNVIPAWPMDGGRLLRGALWPLLGWRQATVLTTVLALVLSAGFAALAALLPMPFLFLVAAFVAFASWGELQRALAAADGPPRVPEPSWPGP